MKTGEMKKVYLRPKTRGELKDNLLKGLESEIVANNESITGHLIAWLDLWLGGDFAFRDSENKGWSVCYPLKKGHKSWPLTKLSNESRTLGSAGMSGILLGLLRLGFGTGLV